jgi:hypothetical protein
VRRDLQLEGVEALGFRFRINQRFKIFYFKAEIFELIFLGLGCAEYGIEKVADSPRNTHAALIEVDPPGILFILPDDAGNLFPHVHKLSRRTLHLLAKPGNVGIDLGAVLSHFLKIATQPGQRRLDGIKRLRPSSYRVLAYRADICLSSNPEDAADV